MKNLTCEDCKLPYIGISQELNICNLCESWYNLTNPSIKSDNLILDGFVIGYFIWVIILGLIVLFNG